MRWLREHPRGLLAYEQRLGKTGVSLRALPRACRVIILCPLGLRLAWRDAILGAPDSPSTIAWRPDLRVRVARSGDSVVPERQEAVILNYEGLPDELTRSMLVADNLRDVFLILDEAHLVNNPAAERTRKTRALARQVQCVWALTGTPMPGTPAHLWGLLETCGLHRKAYGSFKNFLKVFGGKKKKSLGGEYSFSVTDLDPARAGLGKVMLRKRRRDVFPEMPPKLHVTLPVEIMASEKIEGAWGEWQLRGATTLPPFELLSEALSDLARAKIPAMLEEVIRHEDLGLPLLVFSSHVDPILALDRREGWKIITGEVNVAERHEIVKRFQAGELRGIGITIKAGGTGLTLPRAADELFVSLDWVPSVNEQAEDRAISIQDKSKRLTVNTLVADHPLDRRLHEILRAKETLIADVVG